MERKDVSLKRIQKSGLKFSESGKNKTAALVNASKRKTISTFQSGPQYQGINSKHAKSLHGYHCPGLFLECALSLKFLCHFYTLITKVVGIRRNKLTLFWQ